MFFNEYNGLRVIIQEKWYEKVAGLCCKLKEQIGYSIRI